MPAYDEASKHSITIDAPAGVVWNAILETDFTSHPLTGSLLALRALPGLVASPRTGIARLRQLFRSDRRGASSVLGHAFALLEAREPDELVLGLTGRFWTLTGGLVETDAATFRDPVPEGLARAAWGFAVSDEGPRTRLRTETRVLCGGEAARRSFRRYWAIIRPFSGLIRILILGQVRRQAAIARGRSK